MVHSTYYNEHDAFLDYAAQIAVQKSTIGSLPW